MDGKSGRVKKIIMQPEGNGSTLKKRSNWEALPEKKENSEEAVCGKERKG